MEKSSLIDKRHDAREDSNSEVELRVHEETLFGRACNVSRDGMLVELPAGLRVTVECEGHQRTGTVVRVQAINPLRWAMGIHFDDEAAE